MNSSIPTTDWTFKQVNHGHLVTLDLQLPTGGQVHLSVPVPLTHFVPVLQLKVHALQQALAHIQRTLEREDPTQRAPEGSPPP